MYIPVDNHGDWLAISILGRETICGFELRGEVQEVAEFFQPELNVRPRAISLEEWEQILGEAMDAGVCVALESDLLGSPQISPITSILDGVRNRLDRSYRHALRGPRELSNAS
jgi:hypothetical protein